MARAPVSRGFREGRAEAVRARPPRADEKAPLPSRWEWGSGEGDLPQRRDRLDDWLRLFRECLGHVVEYDLRIL